MWSRKYERWFEVCSACLAIPQVRQWLVELDPAHEAGKAQAPVEADEPVVAVWPKPNVAGE